MVSQSQPSGDAQVRSPEPRSFLPQQDARMKIDPITSAKPTVADLARGFNQLHACHEDTKVMVEEIRTGMGLKEGLKPAAGLSTPWGAFRRTVFATTTSITAVAVIYKVGVVVWPSVSLLLHSLDVALRAGRL